jgi:putative DNA primase/helicase
MSPTLYYGGEAKNLGLVQPLSQTTFEELVNEVFGHPIGLSLTRAQFHSLPKREPAAQRDQDRAKRTRFVIPGSIPDTTERKSANVTTCNLVFLDVDNREQAQLILDKLDVGMDLLPSFAHAIHHTATSTPEKPRLRVVVEASAITPSLYPAAVSTVARLLGMESVTAESKVVSQPMFLPVLFHEQDAEKDHPLIHTQLTGRAFTTADIGGGEEPTSPTAGHSTVSQPPAALGEADLDNLSSHVDWLTVDRCRGALSHLDPDMDRKDWINVGAGLKHQFGDDGRDLWSEWSAKGRKFDTAEELETQWKSLRTTPVGRRPITARSIIRDAEAAGWKRPSEVLDLATDLDASIRFAAAHKDKLRFVKGIGWLVWDGLRWAHDDRGMAMEYAKTSARAWFNKWNQAKDVDDREKRIRSALTLEGGSHIKNALSLAQTDPMLAMRSDELDTNQWLLNVNNGTLDLRTGELREHQVGDYITKLARVEYTEGAAHPTLDQLLSNIEETMGAGSVDFIARCFGASLTGDSSPETLFLLQGDGGAGKTTLVEAFANMMGDYAAKLPFDAFVLSKHGRSSGAATPDLVGLRGARLAFASEGDEGARFDAGIIKQITGGEMMTARALHQMPIKFPQTWKLWLVSNYEPRCSSDDTGLWRRLLKIRFAAIPPEKRDPRIKEILGAVPTGTPDPNAQSALLAWAVKGCLDWQARGRGRIGLAAPDHVEALTAAYRTSMDTTGQWWDDLILTGATVDPVKSTPNTTMRSSYEQWCNENGGTSLGLKRFHAFLERKGLVGLKTKLGREWRGICLTADQIM